MQIAIQELLDYSDEERLKWARWFEDNQGALDIDVPGDATSPYAVTSVRTAIQHLFGTQLWWVERMRGSTPTEWWRDRAPAREALFRLGEDASIALREWCAAAGSEDWDRIHDPDGTGRYRPTARKVVGNMLVHAIRHWAQVALLVRQHGLVPPGQHDLILSSALR